MGTTARCEYNKKWKQANPDKVKASCKKWRQANLDKAKACCKKVQWKMKLQAIVAYGGKCECCGEAEPAFLTIDHIDGSGQADRAIKGIGYKFLSALRELGWPKENYRLLCMNCNFARRFGKRCPHE